MRTKTISIYTIICLMAFPFIGGAQSSSATSDSVVVKALRDEIYRNLNQLNSAEAGKPCYISYVLLRGTRSDVSAYLGALVNSSSSKLNDYYIRLLMGSFQVSDENFEDPYSPGSSQTSTSMNCPLDDSYVGIRRSFWWNTDNVFRSASKKYKNKLTVFKDKTLPEEFTNLPDYTPAVPLKADFSHGKFPETSMEQLKSVAKEVSSVFRSRSQIINSGVNITAVNAIAYVVTTEGTEIKIPLNLAVATIGATISNDGEPISDKLVYVASILNQLPSADTLKQNARILADYLALVKDAKAETEPYTGPIMLCNQAVASAFGSTLFGGSTPLIASRELLINSVSKKITSRNSISMEAKLNKRIVSKDITVTLRPHLSTYNGASLLGSYPVDGEGIVPSDELVLVDRGVLKNLMSNRVPTPKVKASSGSYRLFFNGYGTSFADGPGVAFVTTDAPKSNVELMAIMKEEVESKGLDRAYVVRPLISSCSYSPFCYYRVDMETGKETMVRSLEVSTVTLNSMNKVLGCGATPYLANFLLKPWGMGTDNTEGLPVSMIVPGSVVLQELTLEPQVNSFNSDVPLLENPAGSHEEE